MHPSRIYVLLAALAAAACGCKACGVSRAEPGAEIVARYSGGEVTSAEIQREANRMPPALREQFETVNGRRELVSAMIDKRLLFEEARRRELPAEPDIARQVRELEERLAIQALLAAEEKKVPPPTEAEARAWFDAHAEAFAQPERLRVARVLARVQPGASDRERTFARERAARFAERLRRGEPIASVARDGDGPEREKGGDLGFVTRGVAANAAAAKAAFALAEPGAVSPVFQDEAGFAVLQIVERQAARTPPFEEVRRDVENRMSPERKRKVFDDLLARLRRDAEVRIELEAGPR